MAQHTPAAPQPAALPVIDMSLLESSASGDQRTLAETLADACLDNGFFYISNHGVPGALTAEVLQQCQSLFSLSEAEKERINKARSPANRGYEPLKGQTLEPGAPPDLKEGFYIGEELGDDDPRVQQGRFNQGPNQWPESLPQFQDTMMRYFDVMNELSSRIMTGLALSLELPRTHFADFCRQPMSTLRLLHYPPQPPRPAPGEKGCGAHTDFGGITILLLDDNAGLQVWNHQEQGWMDVDPQPGTFVVNLGDMIARWTNDRYRSTLHRVLNISGTERYSVPFFYSGNPDHEVVCLPSCLKPGEQPHYPPTTVEAHLMDMYRRTYA